MHKVLLSLAILVVPALGSPRTNWSGPYQPCFNRNELTKSGHMDLGVRFDTSSPAIAQGLRRALKFWSGILDMDFHEVTSHSCALAVVDATPGILSENNDVARAQFTDWADFQGWIAFDPNISQYMSADEVYATAVHELGHVFGLLHNNHANSVMFYLDADGSSVVDETDLRALAARHTLRSTVAIRPIAVLSFDPDESDTKPVQIVASN